ncbi:HAD family phosphatase [Paenalcaligenes niemegkensis]|uniref:HAD family hydrolase n=1 Tax=Paenalcaligenes niemegkensis TaxID=2895469 RepID=UPI001EE82860|nr:HAD family phosphatase [Paenalcaligenes niemegkensis]MCQ9618062.1 HAD family phosphatase [Paenalcaligenes niemegkensis]
MSFEAVIFDCDGVLVDSEPLTLGVLRDMLAELGWELSADECEALFIGKSTANELQIIQNRIGKKLEQDWIDEFQLRRNQALKQKLVAVPGIRQCLSDILKAGSGKIACASAAELQKINLQLNKVGLIDLFDGHLFSGVDVPRNKPYPDVYLKAAEALATDPQHCAIVEDSITGIRAGFAAGATVFAYDPKHNPEPLLNAGAAVVFNSMCDLPNLLRHYDQQ